MKKITRTFVRTQETMDRYIKEAGERVESDPFMNWHEKGLVKEFTHWVIVENDYPYDAIATTSHILCTKRKVLFEWELLTNEETDELTHIKKDYLSQNYDLIWENLPKGQTVPVHFHLNLLILKRESV
jgi:hypothetical protein